MVTDQKDIVFVDIDTIGIDFPLSTLIRIDLLKRCSDSSSVSFTKLINPEQLIPEEITKINGITNAMVKNAPVFKKIAQEVLDFIENCTLVGYNINKFDWPFLVEALLNAEISLDTADYSVIDLREEYMKQEPRTLAGAYKHFTNSIKDNTFAEHENTVPLNADTYVERIVSDTTAMSSIFDAQIEQYTSIPDNPDLWAQGQSNSSKIDLANKFIINSIGNIVFNFGKYNGKTLRYLEENDPSYFTWILTSTSFAQDTKAVIRKYIASIERI